MINGVRTVLSAAVAALALVASASAELTRYYTEDFCLGAEPQCFDSGFGIEGQHGWSAIPRQTVLGHTDTRARRTGFLAQSRGAGFGFERICQSPKFATIAEPTGEDYVIRVVCALTHARTTWYITPENRTNGRIATRLRFGADGSLAVLIPDGQGGGDFQTIQGLTWSPRTLYRIDMAFHNDGHFELRINDQEIAEFEAFGFAVGIESIGFETNNERVDQGLFVDKIFAWRGNLSR